MTKNSKISFNDAVQAEHEDKLLEHALHSDGATEAKHILLRSSAEFLGHGRSAVHGRGPCAPDLPPQGTTSP